MKIIIKKDEKEAIKKIFDVLIKRTNSDNIAHTGKFKFHETGGKLWLFEVGKWTSDGYTVCFLKMTREPDEAYANFYFDPEMTNVQSSISRIDIEKFDMKILEVAPLFP